MMGIKKYLATTFLSAAMLFSGVAHAMEIQKFDAMAQDDQAKFVSQLIQGAETVLANGGRSADADKVKQLFSTNIPGAAVSTGMAEFMRNLARARLVDAKNVEKDPSARRIEVEDAMAVTLKKNGIELPQSFFTVTKDFQPKSVPNNTRLEESLPGTAVKHR